MSEKMNGEFVKWWEQQNEDHLDKLTAREAWQAAWAACREEAVKVCEETGWDEGEFIAEAIRGL